MKLNIGAGAERFPGFKNVDFDERENPDYNFNVEKDVWPFEDNSVEEIIANHVLEHLGDGFMHCMQEMYRVLKHGSSIHIRVPHHRHNSYYADPTHKRTIMAETFRMMGKKHNKSARENKWRTSRLADVYDIDFEVVHEEMIPDEKFRNQFQNVPKEEAEMYVLQHWNIVSELAVTLVVVKE